MPDFWGEHTSLQPGLSIAKCTAHLSPRNSSEGGSSSKGQSVLGTVREGPALYRRFWSCFSSKYISSLSGGKHGRGPGGQAMGQQVLGSWAAQSTWVVASRVTHNARNRKPFSDLVAWAPAVGRVASDWVSLASGPKRTAQELQKPYYYSCWGKAWALPTQASPACWEGGHICYKELSRRRKESGRKTD